MRIYTALILAIAISIYNISTSHSQISARVSGLESDSVYMQLLIQEQQLKVKEDSIQNQINTIRANFSEVSQEDRVSLGRIIMEAESDLFEVRTQTGIITNQINGIEQDYIISNLNSNDPSTYDVGTSTSAASTGSNVVDLFSNSYFTQNLSSTDLESLKRSNELEASLPELASQYIENYNRLSELRDEYIAVDNQYSADTIIRMFNTISSINKTIEESMTSAIGYSFDNKLYAFNYLYDKVNNNAKLSSLNSQLQSMRNNISDNSDGLASVALYSMLQQRLFLCEQELIMAEDLGLTLAADSLRTLREQLQNENYAMAAVAIEERIFIKYDTIAVKSGYYTTSNPIPAMEHYRRGTVYRIFVGSFTKIQPASVFRNTIPVYYDHADSRYSYFLGGFRTEQEALEAQAQLSKIGFRKPQVVVWIDDVYENLSESGSTTTSTAAKSTTSKGSFFRVEIVMANTNESLSSAHQSAIAELASGKELSRLYGDNGEPIFAIGTFSSSAEAEALASKLNEAGGCTATVKQL